MDNDVIRESLIYIRERLQDERGSDFRGVEALRLAILKFIPDGFTVLDHEKCCVNCKSPAAYCTLFCTNCGLRIIRRD